ncbi:DUF3072 domain-containing protein, partial [Bradyrhizobium retamae]|uniref:DUF3072 domain-containing protein n=1 Tax=Bradyrhizobium retamae TaxID=1300035 RepID=UPI0012E36F98
MTMTSKTRIDSNTEKDPDDWVSGDEPMTGAQASYLKTLCEQAHCAEAFKSYGPKLVTAGIGKAAYRG